MTKPSPFAEFIEPKIPDYNANPKASKPRAKKEPVEAKASKPSARGKVSVEKTAPKPTIDSDNDELISLAERMAKSTKTGKSDTTQSKLNFQKITSSKDSDIILSDNDSDAMIVDTPPLQRDKRTVARKKYDFDESEDEKEVSIMEDDSEEDFMLPKKPAKKASAKKTQKSSDSVSTKADKSISKASKAPQKTVSKKPQLILKKTTPTISEIDDNDISAEPINTAVSKRYVYSHKLFSNV